LLDIFQLGPFRHRGADTLSGRTQRRLSLALALLHEPRAIVFDEPTVALDPNLRGTVWELLADLRAQGPAVLFSTRYMDEADHLCLLAEFGVEVLDLPWGHGSLDNVFTRLVEATAADGEGPAVTVEHGALARRGART
jgi:ABC-type uncharacterized transport system ATPase subunit